MINFTGISEVLSGLGAVHLALPAIPTEPGVYFTLPHDRAWPLSTKEWISDQARVRWDNRIRMTFVAVPYDDKFAAAIGFVSDGIHQLEEVSGFTSDLIPE